MKNFLPILVLLLSTSVASAAPYIVYTGTVVQSSFSSAGLVKKPTTIHVIADAADSSTFTILQEYPSTMTWAEAFFPLDNDLGDENNNFLGGTLAPNGKSGTGILSIVYVVGDSNNGSLLNEFHLTGPLTLRPTTLVPARTKPLVVTEKLNGVVQDTVTYSTLTPAITTGNSTVPMSLTGTFLTCELDANNAVVGISAPVSMTLKEDPALTSLANIGGALTVGKNVYAVDSVDGVLAELPVGSTVSDAFAGWIQILAIDGGYTLLSASEASPAGTSGSGAGLTLDDGGFSGTTMINGGTLNWAGSSLGNVSSAGTITLTSSGILAPNGNTLIGSTTTSTTTVNNVLNASDLTWNAGGTLKFTLDNTITGTGAGATLTPTDSTIFTLTFPTLPSP